MWQIPGELLLPGLPDMATRALLYRRPADDVRWERAVSLGKVSEVTMPSVNVDDWFFAVATADAAGNESLPQPTGLAPK